MANVPEIRVYSPIDRENSTDKTFFNWQNPAFDVLQVCKPKSDNQPARFFGNDTRSIGLSLPADAKNLDLPDVFKMGLVSWENTFNMRARNLSNFPTSTTSYRTACRSQAVAMQHARLGIISGTDKSLDILRQNMQRFINKEIDGIIQKYLDKFFKPGIQNLKSNNGEHSVSDSHIQAVCRQILEEAKQMYQPDPTSPADLMEAESNSSNELKLINHPIPKLVIRKRKESDSNSEASFIPVKPKKRKGRPPNILSGRSTPLKLKLEQVKREGPKWDPSRLTPDSLFIMGAKANKALGLGATRGRIYMKHPDVFKYSGDQEDKQWLCDHNLMPATGGKAYMLLVEDIKELAETDEYRNSPALMRNAIVGFTVPEAILVKMKKCMLDMRTDNQNKKRGKASVTNSEGRLIIKFSKVHQSASRTNSPVEELDMGSSVRSPNPSVFSMSTGLDDVSPAQVDLSPAASDLSTSFEPPLTAPFDISTNPDQF